MSIEELKQRVRARVLAVTGVQRDEDLPIGLTTEQAALVLNRRKKTLLNWSSAGGPVKPIQDARGRLCWPIDGVEAVMVREAA